MYDKIIKNEILIVSWEPMLKARCDNGTAID